MSAAIERLINLLAYLLNSPRPRTVHQIRKTVPGYGGGSDQAFHRKFARDKSALRRLGITLEMAATDVWEVEKGYFIPDESRTVDPGLTEEERTALALAVHLVQTGGWEAGSDALLKLGGARFIHPGEPVGADIGLETEGERLGLVFQAVLERSRLSFMYGDRRRTLEPYGMCYRWGHWYFAGAETDPQKGKKVLVYRLDRATKMAVKQPAAAFERPEDFSIRDALSSLPWQTGPSNSARVRWDADVAWWAENRFPDARRVERYEDGSIVLDIPYQDKQKFIGRILSMDGAAVILEPSDLRDALIEWVRGNP